MTAHSSNYEGREGREVISQNTTPRVFALILLLTLALYFLAFVYAVQTFALFASFVVTP